MSVSVSVLVQLLTGVTSSNSILSPLLVVGMPSESSGRREQNGVTKRLGQMCSQMIIDLLVIRMNGNDGIRKWQSKNGGMRFDLIRIQMPERWQRSH